MNGPPEVPADPQPQPPTLLLRVIHIPSLPRHLGAGWTEHQLLTGKVYTVGRAEVEVRVQGPAE
jgi:hypothetical protein